MDKLQYDSFYKFLVSLGVILIALPGLALIYLTNDDFTLISQTDYDALSVYSQQKINNYEQLFNFILKNLPWISIILITIGIILISFGGYKWYLIQIELDDQVKSDTITKRLNATQLSSSETVEKAVKEVSESDITSNNSEVSTQKVVKYMQMEDAYFHHIVPIYSKDYRLKRNLRIGKYEYDFVAYSKRTNIDLLFEVKYWVISPRPEMLNTLFTRAYNAGVNYETIAHRNFSFIIVIITPQDILEKVRLKCMQHFENSDINYGNKITLRFIASEDFV